MSAPNNNFFALTSRMKYITRWGLMRNTRKENIAEHSLEVAIIAHLLCEIKNKRFGGNVDACKAIKLALYHDVPEIITGDLPTPVKYYSPVISEAYKDVEKAATEKLLLGIPEDLRDSYKEIFDDESDPEIRAIVKAADKISALIKCIEERQTGNSDFISAEKQTLQSIKKMSMPEAEVFLSEFLPSYSLTLDEL